MRKMALSSGFRVSKWRRGWDSNLSSGKRASHPLDWLDAEQAQAGLHDRAGARAQHEAAGLHGRIVHDDAVGGVEGAVGGRRAE